ncbi:ba3-type cytochrome C oxidase subunit II [Deinococcus rubellus]|uniref:Cupredoxin domain-containing protein n=1 Tax=Deinococcus rubellus TaxID=1889240 RepID=A0ABY5YL46_9DEIO|nr:cupredoxin domain-containing protein [Deinococcus rubellus]UWX65533.1 cupredoxin domain-containing protein [Deinococcus rubellus]
MLDHDRLERAENLWLGVATVMTALLLAGVFVSFLSGTFPQLKGGHAGDAGRQVDPTNLAVTPFATPGLRPSAAGTPADLYIVAKAFSFEPAVVRVPAGQPLSINVTSQDVIHGFYVEGSNINIEVIPGQVATFRHTFTRPGTYNVVCNEYCGIGHQNMVTRFVVTAPENK